jgi:hypothetical protein
MSFIEPNNQPIRPVLATEIHLVRIFIREILLQLFFVKDVFCYGFDQAVINRFSLLSDDFISRLTKDLL